MDSIELSLAMFLQSHTIITYDYYYDDDYNDNNEGY